MQNKTVIIEFNGLPGTGKSTITKELKSIFLNEGFEARTSYRRYFWHRYVWPVLIVPYSISLFLKLKEFSKTIMPPKKRTHLHIVISYVRMYRDIYKCCKSNVIIVDQGILQAILSIAKDDLISNETQLENVIKKIKSFNIDFVRIDCKNSIGLSEKRVLSRPSINHYLEKCSKEMLHRTLEIQSNNLILIRRAFSKIFEDQYVVQIDTSISPVINARLIAEKIITKYFK